MNGNKYDDIHSYIECTTLNRQNFDFHLQDNGWLELAVKIGECCPSQRTSPAWAITNDAGEVTGCWNAQCPGCGRQGGTWHCSPIVNTDVDDYETVVDDLLTEFDRNITEVIQTAVVAQEAALQLELDEAVEHLRTGGDAADLDGSPEQPGVYVDFDAQQVVAWGQHPLDPSECVTVVAEFVPETV